MKLETGVCLLSVSSLIFVKINSIGGTVCRVSFVTLTNYVIQAQWKPSSIRLLVAELKAEHLQRAFSNANKQYTKRLFEYSAHKTSCTFTHRAFTMLIENELS